MLPNQPPSPPVTTGAGTTPTATQTPAAQAATTSAATHLGQAAVSVTNTPTQPETSGARQRGAQQSTAETARFHPYSGAENRRQRATATVATPAAVMQQDRPRNFRPTAAILSVQRGREFYPLVRLQALFDALSDSFGFIWNGVYTRAENVADPSLGDVGRGALSPASLSFSEQRIAEYQCPALRDLLHRVNAETNSAQRAFLLIKALRAFCETQCHWEGLFTT
ncbi:MAG: hypothetical protein ACRC9R_08940, partial [Enterovibrio sp.]